MNKFISTSSSECSTAKLLSGLAGLFLGIAICHSVWRRGKRLFPQFRESTKRAGHHRAGDVYSETEANETSLRLLIDTIPALVWRTSPTGMNQFANRRLVEFAGRPREWFLGKGWQNLIHPDDLPPTLVIWMKALADGTEYRNSFRLLRGDGVYRWFAVRGEPFRDESGQVTAWYGVLFDIDDRRRAEDALRQTRDKLSRAAQAATLAEVSASIAHEINQPLAAILTNGEACRNWLLKSPPNIERALLTVERAVRDGKAAAEVVSKIRELFRQSAPHKEVLDLNDAIREVLSLMRDELSKGRISVNTELDESAPKVLADRIQMQQVLNNLISNAVDAMERESTHRRILTIRSLRDARGAVRVEVVDSGAGISNAEAMFDSFFTTKKTGMGMGLAICRAIVDSHGGQLWATRNADAGLTVSFTLPTDPEVSL